jgi:hypothetical protein
VSTAPISEHAVSAQPALPIQPAFLLKTSASVEASSFSKRQAPVVASGPQHHSASWAQVEELCPRSDAYGSGYLVQRMRQHVSGTASVVPGSTDVTPDLTPHRTPCSSTDTSANGNDELESLVQTQMIMASRKRLPSYLERINPDDDVSQGSVYLGLL